MATSFQNALNDYNAKKSNQTNLEDIAKSPFGDLEVNKYLYQSGLQNIYNDFQNNMARLSEQEQTQLQDAYTTRELSKKYLGEYASNTGVGDVSGNLLDIYSNYQNNLQNIKANYDQLELNLAQEYQTKRMDAISNILQTDYQINVAKLNQEAQKVLSDITSGNTGGVDDLTYLNNALQDGRINEEQYNQYATALRTENYQNIVENINSGYYGFKTDENGRRVRVTDPKEYLELNKDKMSKRDYQNLKDRLDYQNDLVPNQPINLKEKYGQNFDPKYYVPNENVNSDSDSFQIEGQEYYQVLDSIQNDSYIQNLDYEVSSDVLFELAPNPTNQTIVNYRGNFYEFKGGNWHRLVSSIGTAQFEGFDNTSMIIVNSKNETGAQLPDGYEFDFNRNGGKNDTLTLYKNVTDKDGKTSKQLVSVLEQDWKKSDSMFKLKDPKTSSEREIANTFLEEIRKGQPNATDLGGTDTMIKYINGKFYQLYKGKITEMKIKK